VIELKTGTRIWIAAGFTDLRRGFQGLSSLVETVLEQRKRQTKRMDDVFAAQAAGVRSAMRWSGVFASPGRMSAR